MRQALLYDQQAEAQVRCNLCAHRCLIAPGKRGNCLVRENRQGTLYTLVYGSLLSQALDPIEKKPLYHFYPGSTSYSVATAGCNFQCTFCQNSDISQMPKLRGQILGRQFSPAQVVAAALDVGASSIAFTYTEPTVFFEYSYDIAGLAHKAGIASVYVTNGYMTSEMLEIFQGVSVDHPPWLDAANVDLKSFRDEIYRRVCGARLQPVLDTLKLMVKLGIWVEVTTLIVPEMNDSEGELAEIAEFIVSELGRETPWHVSRFHPDYMMNDRGPTPATTLRRAYEIGRNAGLLHVYVGNMPGMDLGDTLCGVCGQPAISRRGYRIQKLYATGGFCSHCGTAISGRGF